MRIASSYLLARLPKAPRGDRERLFNGWPHDEPISQHKETIMKPTTPKKAITNASTPPPRHRQLRITPQKAITNASTAPFKSVPLDYGQTLSLTSKWLFVKDEFGNEIMRLAPSQSNMRVVAQGCLTTARAIALYFLAFIGLIFTVIGVCGLVSGDNSGEAVGLVVCPVGLLMLIVGGWGGHFFWKKRHDRLLFLTTDNSLSYLVKTKDLPELYALMEMVENWDGSNDR